MASDPTATKRSPAAPKAGKRGRRAWFFAALCILALAWMGVAPRLSQSAKLHDEVQATRSAAPAVSVVAVSRDTDSSDLTLPCNIQAITQTTINARTNGYVAKRFVDIGSHVQAGQLLAIVESPEADQQVIQSAADVARSEAALGEAAANLGKLRAGVAASRSDAARSHADIYQAQADLAHLEAKAQQSEAAIRVARAKQTEAETRLAGAQADLKRAKVGEAIAKTTRDRWRELERANAVAGQEVDEKESDFEASEARVDAATAAVSTAQADISAAQETVRSAEADLDAAKADVASGRQKVSAARSTFESSRSNIDAAISGSAAGQAGIDAARAAVSSTRANLSRVTALQSFERIVAPFSGVITARNVEAGDLVGASAGSSGAVDQANAVTRTGLFGLAKTDELRAEVYVPEDAIAALKNGDAAEIDVQEFPKRSFTGRIFHISGAIDASSRTLLVEVRIPNPEGVLKPGMFGRVHFRQVGLSATLRIPSSALLFDAQGTRVAVVAPDHTLHYRTVVLGRDLGDVLEIRRGLTGSEQVVTNPDDSIREGTRVTAKTGSL